MKEYLIVVKTFGYYEELLITANDLRQAKSIARRFALKELKAALKITKYKVNNVNNNNG